MTENLFWCRNLLAAVLLFTLAGTVASAEERARTSDDQIVVIVSVDGMAGFHLNDPKANLPHLRKLAKEGAAVERVQASLPTVTWPNHTTLVTGVSPAKHGVLANSYWDRKQEKVFRLLPDHFFNKEEIVKAPTVYDVAHDAGLRTAGINWPASRGAKTLDWKTPDVHTDALMQTYATPSLVEEVKKAGLPLDQHELWCKTDKGRERDELYTRMLIHVIEKHRPHLALIHLVEVDHVEHATGPRSPETYAALQFEDDRIHEIQEALEKNFPGRATLIVTSDHGFVEVRQRIQPGVKLRETGLIKAEGNKVVSRRVLQLDQGGSTFIYVLDEQHRAELIDQMAKLFEGAEGIDRVLKPKDFARNGLVSPAEDPRMADLVLTAKDGFTFSDKIDGSFITAKSEKPSGSHGHSPEIPDMHGTFVAWGKGIKSGVTLKEIDNRDIAPTAATLLGLEMKNVEGHPLKKFLTR